MFDSLALLDVAPLIMAAGLPSDPVSRDILAVASLVIAAAIVYVSYIWMGARQSHPTSSVDASSSGGKKANPNASDDATAASGNTVTPIEGAKLKRQPGEAGSGTSLPRSTTEKPTRVPPARLKTAPAGGKPLDTGTPEARASNETLNARVKAMMSRCLAAEKRVRDLEGELIAQQEALRKVAEERSQQAADLERAASTARDREEELEDRVAKLNAELTRVTGENAHFGEQAARIPDLEATLQQVRNEKERLRHLAEVADAHREAREAVTARLEEALATIEKLDASHHALGDELNRERGRADRAEMDARQAEDLNAQVAHLRSRATDLETTIEAERQRVSANDSSIRDLRRENQRLQILLDASLSVENSAAVREGERARTLAERVRTLEADLASAEERTSDLESTHARVVAEGQAEKEELRERLTARMEALATTVAEERQRATDLEARLTRLSEVESEAARQRERAERYKEEARRVDQLEADLTASRERVEHLEAELARVESEAHAEKENLRERLTARMETLAITVAEERQRATDLEARLTHLSEVEAEVMHQRERAERYKEEARRADELAADLTTAREHNAQLEAKIARIESESQSATCGYREQVDRLESDLALARQEIASNRDSSEQLLRQEEVIRLSTERLAHLEEVEAELAKERERVTQFEKVISEYECSTHQQLTDLSALFEVDSTLQREQIAALEARLSEQEVELSNYRARPTQPSAPEVVLDSHPLSEDTQPSELAVAVVVNLPPVNDTACDTPATIASIGCDTPPREHGSEMVQEPGDAAGSQAAPVEQSPEQHEQPSHQDANPALEPVGFHPTEAPGALEALPAPETHPHGAEGCSGIEVPQTV